LTRYRIARQVPLNGSGNCIVNFFEIWQEDKASGKQLYHLPFNFLHMGFYGWRIQAIKATPQRSCGAALPQSPFVSNQTLASLA
jgi:hypothetical protein